MIQEWSESPREVYPIPNTKPTPKGFFLPQKFKNFQVFYTYKTLLPESSSAEQ